HPGRGPAGRPLHRLPPLIAAVPRSNSPQSRRRSGIGSPRSKEHLMSIRSRAWSFVLLAPALAAAQSAQPAGQAPQVPPAAEPTAATEPEPPPQPPQPASLPTPAEPKKKGQLYTWLSGGTPSACGQTYANASLGAGYILPSGLAPTAELGSSFGASPTLWVFRPGLTYFLPIPFFSPYVGAFYTRWFVGDGFPDQTGIGGRAGFSLGHFLSFGVIYDHMLGCNVDCDGWSPILSAGASF